jgi:hypothetical protein
MNNIGNMWKTKRSISGGYFVVIILDLLREERERAEPGPMDCREQLRMGVCQQHQHRLEEYF